MNTPPLLLGAALLFWGWQTDALYVAAILAVLLEAARLLPGRWEFYQADLDRIWNLCTLLFLGIAVYVFTASEGPRLRGEPLTRTIQPVFKFFQWMPFYFIPMMAVQAWSQRDRIPLSTFSWWLRRQRRVSGVRGSERFGQAPLREQNGSVGVLNPLTHVGTGPPPASAPEGGVNISYPYFAICLLAASAARARSPWFLGGLFSLLGWAFWARRPRGFSPLAFALSLLAAASLGSVTQHGLAYLQGALQRLDTALMMRFGQGQLFDASEHRTMLGAIGKLKLSGHIVLRVKTQGQPPAGLLREASYNLFKSPIWGGSKREFRVLTSEDDQTTWRLLTNHGAQKSVTIAELLREGKGLLPLPQGTAELQDLSVFVLERNPLGTVRSEFGPGYVEFKARYGGQATMDESPGPEDLQVPASERPALARVVAELKLAEKTPAEALSTLAAFFQRGFEYSTWLGDEPVRGANPSPIAEFLLQRRKGHCEYFATATTLLLRQAGICARYAIGYAVQERRGDEFVVRERHAHAWSLAFVDGVWREVDNTPASWAAVEAGRASIWESVSDVWSRVWFAFCKWRFGQSQWRKYLLWGVVLPLVAILVRLLLGKHWRRASEPAAAAGADFRRGLDSEFYLIEQRLAQQGLGRQEGETASAWLRRITRRGTVILPGGEGLLALHYRLRFDPHGLGPADRTTLNTRVREWLMEFDLAASQKSH